MTPRIEIGIDAQDPERLAQFWATALGYKVGDLDSDGIYLDLIPPDRALPAVFLQRVHEPKHAKNRVHLDLVSSSPLELIGHLQQLGATSIGEPKTGTDGGWWQIMVDPEGNEFCVLKDDGPPA